MKILQCLVCKGEIDIISDEGVVKKVQCLDCGFTSGSKPEVKEPEVITRRVINRGQ